MGFRMGVSGSVCFGVLLSQEAVDKLVQKLKEWEHLRRIAWKNWNNETGVAAPKKKRKVHVPDFSKHRLFYAGDDYASDHDDEDPENDVHLDEMLKLISFRLRLDAAHKELLIFAMCMRSSITDARKREMTNPDVLRRVMAFMVPPIKKKKKTYMMNIDLDAAAPYTDAFGYRNEYQFILSVRHSKPSGGSFDLCRRPEESEEGHEGYGQFAAPLGPLKPRPKEKAILENAVELLFKGLAGKNPDGSWVLNGSTYTDDISPAGWNILGCASNG